MLTHRERAREGHLDRPGRVGTQEGSIRMPRVVQRGARIVDVDEAVRVALAWISSSVMMVSPLCRWARIASTVASSCASASHGSATRQSFGARTRGGKRFSRSISHSG